MISWNYMHRGLLVILSRVPASSRSQLTCCLQPDLILRCCSVGASLLQIVHNCRLQQFMYSLCMLWHCLHVGAPNLKYMHAATSVVANTVLLQEYQAAGRAAVNNVKGCCEGLFCQLHRLAWLHIRTLGAADLAAAKHMMYYETDARVDAVNTSSACTEGSQAS